MKYWNRAFDTWKNFCPFVKRELYSKKDFIKWAQGLGLISTTQEDDFYVFLIFLEDCEILCPLTVGHEKIEDVVGNAYWRFVGREKKSAQYHPIQFFEVVNWLNHANSKKPPYYYSEEYRDYYYLRRLQYKLEDYKKSIENYKKRGMDIEFTKDHLKKLEDELVNRIREGKTDYPQGYILLKELIVGFTSPFITEDYLISWIKFESLLLNHDAAIFGPNHPDMRLKVNSRSNGEVEQCIKDYRLWRDNLTNNIETNFNEKDKKNIKEFHFYMGHKIGDGPFGRFGTKGNWMDLFDIILPYKKNKLGGQVSIYINLLNFRRYIEEAYWELFKKNIMYNRETDDKPYFLSQGEGDYREYIKSVLLDFNLFSSNPFILYVEGQSESVIIEEYVNRKPFIRFKIRNIRGVPNARHYMKISKDSEEHEYFFFFDFDSKEEYEKRMEEYQDRCSFFFPDFMTENFTTDQFNEAFLSWINEINIKVSKEQKMIILGLLKHKKVISNEIISEIEKGMELTERSPKGFEKVLVDFLVRNCKEELVRIFPNDIGLDPNGYIKKASKKFFKDLMKEEISNRLKLLVIDSMTRDPERRRSEKFKFEVKLKPFMDRLLKIVNRTPTY